MTNIVRLPPPEHDTALVDAIEATARLLTMTELMLMRRRLDEEIEHRIAAGGIRRAA